MYREFKAFLIKHGVLRRYTTNLIKFRTPGYHVSDDERIYGAFLWDYTTEGDGFWSEISDAWDVEYKKLSSGQVH